MMLRIANNALKLNKKRMIQCRKAMEANLMLNDEWRVAYWSAEYTKAYFLGKRIEARFKVKLLAIGA